MGPATVKVSRREAGFKGKLTPRMPSGNLGNQLRALRQSESNLEVYIPTKEPQNV